MVKGYVEMLLKATSIFSMVNKLCNDVLDKFKKKKINLILAYWFFFSTFALDLRHTHMSSKLEFGRKKSALQSC